MDVNRVVKVSISAAVVLLLWAGPALAHDATIELTKSGNVVASKGHTTNGAETWDFTWTLTGNVQRMGLYIYSNDSNSQDRWCDGTKEFGTDSIFPNDPQPLVVTTAVGGRYCVHAYMPGAGGGPRPKVTIAIHHSP
jgi:hypothetical protein